MVKGNEHYNGIFMKGWDKSFINRIDQKKFCINGLDSIEKPDCLLGPLYIFKNGEQVEKEFYCGLWIECWTDGCCIYRKTFICILKDGCDYCEGIDMNMESEVIDISCGDEEMV